MSKAILWLRHDLRLADNPALWHAVQQHDELIILFIYQDNMPWTMGAAQRWWLHHSLLSLQHSLTSYKAQLVLRRGDANAVLQQLIQQYPIEGVYWNRCYDPQSVARDKVIKAELSSLVEHIHSYNGLLLNEPWTVLNKAGSYFKVFTPYWRAAQQSMLARDLYPVPKKINTLAAVASDELDTWQLLPTEPNWAKTFESHWQVGEQGAQLALEQFIAKSLSHYADERDRPDKQSTSRLSPHLHFGEIGPWQIWQAINTTTRKSAKSIERFKAELGWREFSYYLLYHFPQLPEQNFRPEFDAFPWVDDQEALRAWQRGQTGYPIVDAGMRELWATGYMHNRVRMIVASFLIKDLLIDWRQGAEWFWDTLVDADLASNSASWQWVAGSGADAAPYFRIFNPVLQGEKFDPAGDYVRQWVPELRALAKQYIHQPWQAPAALLQQAGIVLGEDYPEPIVDHAEARKFALASYQAIKQPSEK